MTRRARVGSEAASAAATAVGAAGAFAAALFPLHNPDVFWHLAVGRRMAELGGPLFQEPLALAGAAGRPLPWTGFEWLSELFFYKAWALGGFLGLALLKAAFAAATAWALDAALRRGKAAPAARVLAVLAWAALSQRRFMLEPELFTFLFLALLAAFAPERRAWTRAETAAGAALFALWANLHGGFVYGLGLLALRALDERSPLAVRGGRLALFAACAAATPYGPAGYGVAFHLLGELKALHAGNIEWMSPALLPGLWLKAYFLLPLAGLLLARRRGAGAGTVATLALFGLWGALAVRNVAVAATALVPLVGALASPELEPFLSAVPALAAAALGFAALHGQARAGVGPWREAVAWRDYPRALCEAVERAGLRGGLWTPFDWASYPAWRFAPERRVYAYGRLDVFHERLLAAQAARERPESWTAFLEANGVEAALERPPRGQLRGAVDDPARKASYPVLRSPFAAYYPPGTWALVDYTDEGFLWARRRPGRPELLDPTDEEYLRLALAKGWLDRRRACVQARRPGPSRWDAALARVCEGK